MSRADNTLLSATRPGSFIAGPALAGVLVHVLTAPAAMFVDSVSFLASAALIQRVRVHEAEPATAEGRLVRHAMDGMRYLWHHPYLSASLRCCICLNFFSFVVTALLILFASAPLGLSAMVIGLAFGLGAVGGLAGALLAGRTSRRLGVGPTIALGAVLFSAPAALLPLASGSASTKGAVLAGVEMLSAAGIILFDESLNALQNAVTTDAMRSRVSGAFSSVNYGIRPLGRDRRRCRRRPHRHRPDAHHGGNRRFALRPVAAGFPHHQHPHHRRASSAHAPTRLSRA